MNAPDLLAMLVDHGTYRSWDSEPVDVKPDPAYAAELARAREKTGLDEAVITGEGSLRGHRVAVAASEFGFLGGSIGIAVGERLTAATERATAERLPLIVLPASGGTRMQEGTIAFLQMAKITGAIAAHKAAGLPYLVYLRHPATGGVLASWGSLGHITLAEPGALIGFLGPRAFEALHGSPLPDGVQTAENLRAHGIIDAIVPPDELACYLAGVLTALTPAPAPVPRDVTATAPAETPAWDSVIRSRQAGRPGAADLIRAAATDVTTLRDTGVILALARLSGRPCVLVGYDRNGPPPGTAALRTARRGIRLAAELRLPLITVIDTLGAELSQQAEEDGLAREIALCMAELITLQTPTISVLLGPGTGGAALALFPADRVIAAQHSWLAPLAPEGASAIVHRGDTSRAADLAARQGIRAADLATHGAIDHVIAETSAGQLVPDLTRTLHRELANLTGSDETRMCERRRRYRNLGAVLSLDTRPLTLGAGTTASQCSIVVPLRVPAIRPAPGVLVGIAPRFAARARARAEYVVPVLR
jgi:acetyl-CoA carboxylase carboxyl transferase subunit beta